MILCYEIIWYFFRDCPNIRTLVYLASSLKVSGRDDSSPVTTDRISYTDISTPTWYRNRNIHIKVVVRINKHFTKIMSLNKFMHPRNIYRRPPDFKILAIKYPEFRKHAKQVGCLHSTNIIST